MEKLKFLKRNREGVQHLCLVEFASRLRKALRPRTRATIVGGGGGLDMRGVFCFKFVFCVDNFRVLYVCVSVLLWYMSDGCGMLHCFQEPRCGSRTLLCLFYRAMCVRVALLSCRVVVASLFRGRGAPPEPPECPTRLRWGLSFVCLMAHVSRAVSVSFRVVRHVVCACVGLYSKGGYASACKCSVVCVLLCGLRLGFSSYLFLHPLLLCAHPYQVARAPRSVFASRGAPERVGPVFADFLLEL